MKEAAAWSNKAKTDWEWFWYDCISILHDLKMVKA